MFFSFSDVATFLKCPKAGIKYFGPEYRPVPLETTFIGVQVNSSIKARNLMDELAFEKTQKSILKNDQVMIFVHSRRETQRIAQFCKQRAGESGNFEKFLPNERDSKFLQLREKFRRIKNPDLKNAIMNGFGFHHAGMPRSERALVEKAFADKVIKVCWVFLFVYSRMEGSPTSANFVRYL